MPAKQHFTEGISHGASMRYSQKTGCGHHDVVCTQRTEQAFAPLPSPWSWAPHSCSVLMTFAPAFHGLANTDMPHCCCLLGKNQPDCDCLDYSSVPAVSTGQGSSALPCGRWLGRRSYWEQSPGYWVHWGHLSIGLITFLILVLSQMYMVIQVVSS